MHACFRCYFIEIDGQLRCGSSRPCPRILKAGASPPSGPDVLTLADCSASASIFAETTPSLPIFFAATRWRPSSSRNWVSQGGRPPFRKASIAATLVGSRSSRASARTVGMSQSFRRCAHRRQCVPASQLNETLCELGVAVGALVEKLHARELVMRRGLVVPLGPVNFVGDEGLNP